MNLNTDHLTDAVRLEAVLRERYSEGKGNA